MKRIIFESLNEVISFTRHNDPLSNLGVGQTHLITSWLDEMNITNYKLNSDLSIDVKYNVDLSSKKLDKIPNYIKFNHIGGIFSCYNNNLTSLKGCPTSVGGSFSCDNNNLTSLKGCTTSVGGDFSCFYNNLTSLKGCPTSVGGGFYCHNNNLTSLEGCPTSVGGSFYCFYNNLTSLKGCPTSVGGGFYCSYNNVKFSKEDVKKLCKVKGNIYI